MHSFKNVGEREGRVELVSGCFEFSAIIPGVAFLALVFDGFQVNLGFHQFFQLVGLGK